MDISARPHLVFEDSAHEVRRQLQQKHHDLVVAVETFNRKLAAHVGKLDGIFARLCVAFHCVEHAAGGLLPQVISEDVARRVAKFMQRFLLPHALSLYSGVLDLSDDHDRLIDMAGYILAHRLEKVSVRDVAQGSPTMRRLTRLDVMQLMEQLEAFGWVRPQPTPARLNASPTWIVSPRVHQLFDERAVAEAERRRKGREIIQEVVSRNG